MNTPSKCPKCGSPMTEWEELEMDCWSYSREEHYTKPSGTEARECDDGCGHEEQRQIEEGDEE